MHGQALALSNTMRMPLVLILSKRRMRFLLVHSRIPLRHLHILMTEHLADGLHRHTCLQRNEAGERVSSRMVGIGKSVLYVNRSTIIAIILLILRSFQRKGLCDSGLKAKSTTFAYNKCVLRQNEV
mgnify:CR=1 FL=1